MTVTPEGDWPCPLPRLGVRFTAPGDLTRVTWFGAGPGEAYADSHRAQWVGRHSLTIEQWQTPYAFPQENGNRRAVRWADLTAADGTGLRITGQPHIELTVRRWTSEDLDRCRHTIELKDTGLVHVNVDLAQQGLGSGSCGPAALPAHRLEAVPMSYSFTLSLLPGQAPG